LAQPPGRISISLLVGVSLPKVRDQE